MVIIVNGDIKVATNFLRKNTISMKKHVNLDGNYLMRITLVILLSVFLTTSCEVKAESFVNIVKQIKPSVVGVGIFDPLGSPRATLTGTGFVIGDGTMVATNFHVVSNLPVSTSNISWAVFEGAGKRPKVHRVEIIAKDEKHDLAILKLPKSIQLNAIQLANNDWIDDGHQIAFTGFPIGEVLGLYHVTHQGMISARTPTIIPAANTEQISAARLRLLKEPYFTYQLDATAYPGNSGSPVYLKSNGTVIAIINKVFVKKSKESVLSDPSNITYAIPVKHLNYMLDKLN